MARGQYAFGKVLGSPTTSRRFFKSIREELSREEQLLFESFFDNIWWYALFTVEEKLGDDFYRIYDYTTEGEHIVMSESVTELRREGKRLFLTLLFENPRCCQTYGIVYPFKGFQPFDIFYFASMLNPAVYETSGLASVIFLNPVLFYLLCLYTEVPAVAHGDELVVQCSSRLQVLDFPEAKISSSYSREESKGVVRWRLLGGDDLFQLADLYWDRKKNLVTLHCSGRKRYTEAANLLASTLALPKEPQYEASLPMMVASREIIGKGLPGADYSSLFEKKPSIEEQEELDRMNGVLREFSDAHNYGRPYDIEELSTKHGIPLGVAKEMEHSYQHKWKNDVFQVKGGIEEYKPPPPVVRRKMQGRLSKNELFDLVVEESTRRLFRSYKPRYGFLFKKDRELSLEELPGVMEHMYEDMWETEDQLEILYTLYILREKGAEFHSVRDYAAEVLRTFGQVILEDDDDKTVSEYIDFYGVYCFHILFSFGLVDIDRDIQKKDLSHPQFGIKATDFFRSWLRWR